MMRSNNPATSMQKTYDECYLVASTAIYFEKQNNEGEALRSWRAALDQIYYHNAYKVPANWRPKTETERALQDSLRNLEMQCKERVDLLDALRKSRIDTGNGSPVIGSGQGNSAPPPPPYSATANRSASGGLGQGSVPAFNYPDIARPQPPQKSSIFRPSNNSRQVTEPVFSNPMLHASHDARRVASSSTLLPATSAERKSRSPSPDKKGISFKSSLRPGTKEPSKLASASMRPRAPAAPASKAASMAWPTHVNGNTPTLSPSGSRKASTEQARYEYMHGPPPARVLSNNFVRPPSAADVVPRRNMSMDLPERPRSHDPQGRADTRGRGMPPPPPPSAANRVVSAPKPDFPSYRTEYPAPEPVNPNKVKALLSSRKTRVEVDSSNSANTEPTSPRKSRTAILRKAVGGGSLPMLSSLQRSPPQPTQPKPASSSQPSPPTARDSEDSKRPRKTKQLQEAPVLAELPVDVEEEPEKKESSEWDARVKKLMKNLPRGVDEGAAKSIFNEIVIKGDDVRWDDVAGLDIAKNALKEAVVYPFLRPDLFMGLREPARGMLLFGPPGTGKTMLARAVATESKSTFFAISASSLTSKYLGESEKLVRALFSIAKALTPSIIFVDEIDSLLSSRSGGNEHEATRRIKTEFLIQWSDLAKAAAGREQVDGDASRVLVLAATNLPWAIDEAARRRFVRRQYIPLPESHVRESQMRKLMSAQKHNLKDRDFSKLVTLTDNFSGSDITALAKDAAMGPLRALGENLLQMSPDEIRPISLKDFEASLINIRPSVSKQGLRDFENWAKEFGERGG